MNSLYHCQVSPFSSASSSNAGFLHDPPRVLSKCLARPSARLKLRPQRQSLVASPALVIVGRVNMQHDIVSIDIKYNPDPPDSIHEP